MTKEEIRTILRASGAAAVGFAAAAPLSGDEEARFDRWIARGAHAGMGYMERHATLRRSLDNVLHGTRTVIAMAFSFVPPQERPQTLPAIARYAYGRDYHKVIPRRLAEPLKRLRELYPQEDFRLCIDSAPVAERYWAVKAGIGFRGFNGSVIVDGCGCYCFLCELLTTMEIEPDAPSERHCLQCGECLRRCPTGALGSAGIDCRRCLSYLTIEHRGDWDAEGERAMATDAGSRTLFGCDICLAACPHNRDLTPTPIAEFHPSATMLSLDTPALSGSDSELRQKLAGSPLLRARPEGLRRNAAWNRNGE